MTKEKKKAETKTEPFLYEVDELIKNASTALGIQPYVAAGALIGINKISLDDAKKRVQQLLKKEVK